MISIIREVVQVRKSDSIRSGLEADFVGELEDACEGVVEHGHALLAQGEAEERHLSFVGCATNVVPDRELF